LVIEKKPYRWVVLALAVLVNLVACGMNQSCMPTLYREITRDIPMTYVQWGIVWGIGSVAMMLFSLVGGMLADWTGIRYTVGLATVAMGVFGIGRAFAENFNQLLCMMFFIGVSYAFVLPNLTKSLGQWFPSSELGLANGILVAGICIGSGLALQLSGVFFSPLLGGWKNVIRLFGVCSILLGFLWARMMREGEGFLPADRELFSFREAISVVVRVRDQWLLMASRFCIFGALLGVIGFLPELLVAKGMKPGLAHLSSSLIYYTNILGVIAIPVLSDRVGMRKIFIWPFSLLAALFIASLCVFNGVSSLAICALLGLLVGFLPLLMALPLEMEGIGHRYFGTSLGLVAGIGNLGGFVAPALGGKFIDSTGKEWTAFIFWGLLMFIGALFILPMKETGSKVKALSVI
jgi:MFS family permease